MQKIPMKLKKNNIRGRLTLLVVLLVVAWCGTVAGTLDLAMTAVSPMDSIQPTAYLDTTNYETPRPRDFNGLRYTLDGSHRYRGDHFTRGHTFLSFGTGALMQQHVNTGGETILPMLHLRMGREFSALHALRIGMTAGMGFLRSESTGQGPWALTSHVGGEIDYLFNLSNYLYGYRPERPLSLSLLLGAGLGSYRLSGSRRSSVQGLKDHAIAYQFHTGLQVRLFASPRSAIIAEPYVQLGNAGSDLSDLGSANWHKYVVNYGLNLSYVYYLNNVLSSPAVIGDFKRTYAPGQRWLRGDADDLSQRRPLFISYAIGATGYSTFGSMGLSSTLGPSYSLAFGGWLSSALGLRLSATLTNASLSESKGRTNMLGYASLGVDALLNPLGFGRHYDWDAPAGVSLLAGMEYGLMKRTNDTRSSSNMLGARVGLQPWVRLGHQTRFYVEPSLAVLVHRTGDNPRTHDRQLSMKVGLEMMLGHRQDEPYNIVNGPLPGGVFVGAGGGWNATFLRWRQEGAGNGLFKNAVAFAGYRLNALSSFLLSGEYLTERFKNGSKRNKWEYWMTSASYQFNVSNWLTGYQADRRFQVSALVGPTVGIHSGPLRWGIHLGMQVDYRVYRQYALFFQQRFYWMGKDFYGSASNLFKPMGTLVNTMNVGVMYRF